MWHIASSKQQANKMNYEVESFMPHLQRATELRSQYVYSFCVTHTMCIVRIEFRWNEIKVWNRAKGEHVRKTELYSESSVRSIEIVWIPTRTNYFCADPINGKPTEAQSPHLRPKFWGSGLQLNSLAPSTRLQQITFSKWSSDNYFGWISNRTNFILFFFSPLKFTSHADAYQME